MQPALHVENLHVSFKTYGRTTEVLKGVNLTVPKGAQVSLVGESGSGKSVTMKTIMDLLPGNATITDGAMMFDGQNLLTMPRRDRLRLRGTAMSMVFQDPMSSLNPVFTIKDQLMTILKYADRRLGRDRSKAGRYARVIEVLTQVRMREPERVAASYPVMLSGGMRQRILIAMALLSEPRLLIADEPGTALDVTTQAQILKLLKDLVSEHHLSLLMITHNLGVVRETSEYVYVMNKGEIVEHGATSALFANPQQQYTRDLIAAVPKLTGRDKMPEVRP
ncbi:ABC transporter ATP-binding protein [Ketogulonicigenium vulgare]|uniref:ABC transporter, nucleotide binding/ATPase protein (Dipeptide) n=1 Tax=Ketogulonicigenium vulgare (strain WSH-001) TaxID=759362 RepID=F9Y9I0_KETVW|nr:ABC transporter ATP-binding protein [Ketogulonicigenium vulgare]ADO41937.1 oligopeptide ABC transporter ATP-binding protein [Ketogulonicigenium vulgare Y25]AEM40162.1 ABC transporter, nucleotide binding/ATPase protein (Dipeptide) [Ketogulonicigenium vulgare WSH-001]ALJ80367.1 dipeptide/oligopeptide/nickel ABC transporter ATP-binding protein [Ketogulonicigenium vulgare]ANW33201.1 dipeptide/oligopeptide/nickel ABC transporter ATP-binding protein [Ketogulonicigenium vulgare]AOZ53861.1 oligopep